MMPLRLSLTRLSKNITLNLLHYNDQAQPTQAKAQLQQGTHLCHTNKSQQHLTIKKT